MFHEVIDHKKIGFMFPGVGSQYSGMGKDLYDNFSIARETFEEAEEVMGVDLKKICFDVQEEKTLNLLEYAKPALLCVSIAAYRVFMQEIGIKPDYCVGYSLGEYSALCCAEVIQFSDAVELVQKRAKIVNEVSANIDGTMAWVVNISINIVSEICQSIRKKGKEIYVSAYDSERKGCISGTQEAIKLVAREVEEMGGMVIPIKMSGPYHSIMMSEAATRLKEILLTCELHSPNTIVLANRNALPYSEEKEEIISNLASQIIEPIYWKNTIAYLSSHDVDTMIEMGPKAVLKYILELNKTKMVCYSTDEEKRIPLLKSKLIMDKQEYPTILGKCLASIVSTPNYNNDKKEYSLKVVDQYRAIERRYRECINEKNELDIIELKRLLQIYCEILKAKYLTEEVIEKEINKITNRRILM